MRKLFRFNGGVHPKQHKDQSTQLPIAVAPLPDVLVLPLSQHVGLAAEPIVKTGQRVLKGELLARPAGAVSAAVHAPTSGTVEAIEQRQVPNAIAKTDWCIVLRPDGEDRWGERTPLQLNGADRGTLLARLRDYGLVGLGGAAFPSHIKLNVNDDTKIRALVINAAECEPYITCDDRLMRERAPDLMRGLRVIAELLQPDEILIGIEDNKPEAASAMRAAAAAEQLACYVQPIPTLYPGGGEKQLIRTLTGIEVPAGRYPFEFGVACFNIASVHAIRRAVELGEPLISRVLTVTGNVAQPRNFEALIGTPMNQLVALAQEHAGTEGYIMGGPMMGFRVAAKDVPVVKATNCIIAMDAKQFRAPPPELPCIRCGTCSVACPADLQPFELYWHAKSHNVDKAKAYGLADCIECGACSYVCPSKIPLVGYFRQGKSEAAAQDRAARAAAQARERSDWHEQRLQRDEREAETSAAAHSTSANAQPTVAADLKQASIEAALQRARSRRSGNNSTG
jgi:Na+-translocating ferredoxin:NAD+ oxidoreductase subunit C